MDIDNEIPDIILHFAEILQNEDKKLFTKLRRYIKQLETTERKLKSKAEAENAKKQFHKRKISEVELPEDAVGIMSRNKSSCHHTNMQMEYVLKSMTVGSDTLSENMHISATDRVTGLHHKSLFKKFEAVLDSIKKGRMSEVRDMLHPVKVAKTMDDRPSFNCKALDHLCQMAPNTAPRGGSIVPSSTRVQHVNR